MWVWVWMGVVIDAVCVFLCGIGGQVLVYNCVDGGMLKLNADVRKSEPVLCPHVVEQGWQSVV